MGPFATTKTGTGGHRISRGGPVSIRRVAHHGNARWLLETRIAGRRRREYHASEAAARHRAAEIKERTRVAGEWWESTSAARRAEFAAVAEEIHAAGLTLGEVWRGYQSGIRAPARVVCPTLSRAIADCVAAKLAAGRSRPYCEALHGELLRFARGVEVRPVREVTLAHVEAHVARAGKSPATRSGALGKVSAFLEWCRRRGWVPENVAERVERVSVPAKVPRILSPAEAATLLAAVPARSRPWVILGLFCGLRPAEADAIRWDDIRPGFVEVTAAASKVRRRRLVPICPTAAAWLAAARALGGELPCPVVTRRRDTRATRGEMGWDAWPADILRHSAASYLLARDKDAPKVADALGHSAGVLFRHYREVVTPEAAAEFWALRP